MGKTEQKLAKQKKIIRDLVAAAVCAVEKQNYFEASVIIFQTVEGLLRIAIKVFGQVHGATKVTLEKCADNETSFWRLVLHFDIIRPDNQLGERLLALNARRNKILHRIFYDFHTMEHLQEELKGFCKEAMALNLALQKILELPNDL